jgi:predicted metal-dependent hydrolase
MHFPAKKSPEDIDPVSLTEPALSASEWDEYLRGWSLFNSGEFWHAHEAWENVWRQRREDSRIFFQGIIQLAAGLHLLLRADRFAGMMRNFDKAEEKLRIFPDRFLGVNVAAVLSSLHHIRQRAGELGPERIRQFDRTQFPRVSVHPDRSISSTVPHR